MRPNRSIDTPKDRSIFPALEQAQAHALEPAVPVATGGTGDLPGMAVERALRLWMDAAVYRIYLRKFVPAYLYSLIRTRPPLLSVQNAPLRKRWPTSSGDRQATLLRMA